MKRAFVLIGLGGAAAAYFFQDEIKAWISQQFGNGPAPALPPATADLPVATTPPAPTLITPTPAAPSTYTPSGVLTAPVAVDPIENIIRAALNPLYDWPGRATTKLNADQWNYYRAIGLQRNGQPTAGDTDQDYFPVGDRGYLMTVEEYWAARGRAGHGLSGLISFARLAR